MRSIRLFFARISIIAMLATAVIVPATPASAHGRLPRGDYVCRQFDAIDGYAETGYVLRIMADRRYAYIRDGQQTGEAGRFRHPTDANKIRFRSGYINSQGWRGIHKRPDGAHAVLLQSQSDGTWYDGATCTK